MRAARPTQTIRHATQILGIVAMGWLATPVPSRAAAETYAEQRDFLARHTAVVELRDGEARAVVCPELQGRVMVSSAAGDRGASLGWINRDFLASGKSDLHFANYGGADRFWLGPEGGQFALFFAPRAAQTLPNWYTPPALNEGKFAVSQQQPASVRLTRQMKLLNASNTTFDLEVTRDVRLLGPRDYAELFGAEAGAAIADKSLRGVGFQTRNAVANRGAAMTRATGLVSIWTLGQFDGGPETVIVVPYRAGDEARLGPIVQKDYFGALPDDRLQVTPTAVLFRGDGQYRSKIGTSPRRAKAVAGSIDFRAGMLTLVHYSLPDEAAQKPWVNNTWKLPQAEPYQGDAFNSYNDGPPEPGAKSLGGFYELETLSPAKELKPGETLVHDHTTIHLQGEPAALARVAKAALGVDLDECRRFLTK